MRYHKPPLSLDRYARIVAEFSMRRDPADATRPIGYEQLLREHALDLRQWAEASAFWTPRVHNPRHPAAFRYHVLLRALRRQGAV